MVATVPAYINNGTTIGSGGLLVELDESGAYVPVVALDTDTGINIGTVAQGAAGESAWPVSVASLPLPTGAATAANQTTIIETLGTPFQAGGAVNQGTSPWIVQQSDNRGLNQTINSATLNAAVTVSLQGGEGVVGWTLTGLTASGASIAFEGTNDIGAGSPTWAGINAVSGTTITSTATTDGNYRVEAGGRTAVRVRVSSIGTGTITVFYSASAASSLVSLAQSLPAGTNEIGGVFAAPTSSNSFAITPGSSSALETSHVLKSSAGNLYSLNCTTTSASGYLMTFNAVSVPADGTVAPLYCIPVPAGSAVSISFSGAPPDAYSTGIVAVFSTTGPFTKTSSATAFFTWRVQ